MKNNSDAIEVIQYPRETVYVPSGLWPHIVLNLQFLLAVTQMYATEYPSGDIQPLLAANDLAHHKEE